MVNLFRPMTLLLPFALIACVEVPMPVEPANPENTCGAAELQGLVGRDAAVLQTMRFSQTVRIIRPGTAVTMDYIVERLNIQIDSNEKISRVNCG